MILNKKVAFYTCLFGKYDFISSPNKELIKKFSFYIITNQNYAKFKNWKKIYVNNKNSSNFLLSRYYKFFFHQKIKKYNYSVYFDANVQLKKNFSELLNKFIINKTGNYDFKLEINEYIELFYKKFC